MIKKILTTAATGAVALTLAASAFAYSHHTVNFAGITTTTTSTAVSGQNTVTGGGYKSDTNHNGIGTGASVNGTLVVTGANDTVGGGSNHSLNTAFVTTTTTSTAVSGQNKIQGGSAKSDTNGNTIISGDSGNQTGVVTVVNSSIQF